MNVHVYTGQPSTAARRRIEPSLDAILARLQLEVEARHDEHNRQRGRLILRGFRAGCWALLAADCTRDIEVFLMQELGLPSRRIPMTRHETEEEVSHHDD
ncbi:hypothetical protein D3C76_938630 [compost metagenome]